MVCAKYDFRTAPKDQKRNCETVGRVEMFERGTQHGTARCSPARPNPVQPGGAPAQAAALFQNRAVKLKEAERPRPVSGLIWPIHIPAMKSSKFTPPKGSS